MPVIRISDATWERLKRWAVPLEDSPEDAIRKTIDSAEEHLKCSGQTATVLSKAPSAAMKITTHQRLRRGQKVPQKAYEKYILEALTELGGKSRVDDVLRIVAEKMKGILDEVDYQPVPSGNDLRWHKTANWTRFALVKRGLLKADSERGFWELSDQGKKSLGVARNGRAA